MSSVLGRSHPKVVRTKGGPVCVPCMTMLNRDVRDKNPARVRYTCPSCQGVFEYSTLFRSWVVRPKT